MFPFQTSTEATLMASASACGHSDSTLNILILTHCAPQSPFIPFHFFPRLFCFPSTTCRGINRSSGGRGLGPFSKNTFEMARHVTEGYPLSCQVTPAVCGQVYLRGCDINTLPPTHTVFSAHKNANTHTFTTSPAPLMPPFMRCPEKERVEISLESPAGTEALVCSTETLEREISWDRQRGEGVQRKRQYGSRQGESTIIS